MLIVYLTGFLFHDFVLISIEFLVKANTFILLKILDLSSESINFLFAVMQLGLKITYTLLLRSLGYRQCVMILHYALCYLVYHDDDTLTSVGVYISHHSPTGQHTYEEFLCPPSFCVQKESIPCLCLTSKQGWAVLKFLYVDYCLTKITVIMIIVSVYTCAISLNEQ